MTKLFTIAKVRGVGGLQDVIAEKVKRGVVGASRHHVLVSPRQRSSLVKIASQSGLVKSKVASQSDLAN